MGRPLSVGARWTIRYAVFTSVALGAFAYVLHHEFRERVGRDANLVVRLQLKELAEELEKHREDSAELSAYVDAHVESAAQDLRLGIRILDRSGRVLLEKGGPDPFPLPAVLPAAGSEPQLESLDLGESYPFYTTVFPAGPDFIQMIFYSRAFERSSRDMRNLFLYALPPMILATSLFGWWLVRGTLRPIARIDEAARRISASRLEDRIAQTGSGDELDRLAGTLNEMLVRVHAGVGQIRRFGSNAAHELRAPISRLRHRIEDALSRERDPLADEKLLLETLADVDGIAATVSALLDLAHSEGGLDAHQVHEVSLASLLDGVADFFEPTAEARGIELHRAYRGALAVRGEPNWLRQLFANLLDNAIKFSERGARVELEAEEDDGEVRVRVHDYGRGIPAEERERIFDPFHRAEQDRGVAGVGLGLALARQIAVAHGGSIEVESTEGQGSTFTVRLARGA
jgi:two-component system heavy metal sensor histidine kinase CusS